MKVFYVDNNFDCLAKNPYNDNQPYTSDWILIKLLEDASFKQFTGGGVDGIFRLIITKKNIDWAFGLNDFIGYETSHNKNIIVAANESDLVTARTLYKNHSFMDRFLRPYEQRVLMHTTDNGGYKAILKDGCLKSWNMLNKEGKTNQEHPIGKLLGDPPDYSDYIMFTNGGASAERVVLSKQKNKLEMNIDTPYTAGARLYFDAEKIAKDGLLTRDGAHLKVKDKLELDKYLLWTALPCDLGLAQITTPREFAIKADKTFEDRFGIKLQIDTSN